MSGSLFGIETEYGVTGTRPNGAAVDRTQIVDLMRLAATESYAHAPDVYGSGLFLQNASRFYIDCGLHPELATPECVDPGELVRYVLAGERILAELAGRVQCRLPSGTQVSVYRCNVDYSGTGSTWGCHESYLHRVEPMALVDQLIPHLVTRIIYTGAGGFNPGAAGLEFSLSPRVHHLVSPVSPDSTSCRGIFHTKDEPLCADGYHRLHVLCGDSCCSQLATWLKIGTTALVVALTEAGVSPGDGVQLGSPIQAMRAVARDPECRAPLTMAGGGPSRAIDIQRHYLKHAEAHLGDRFMPEWGEKICCAWRAVLDGLEADPRSLAGRLDWGMKQQLFARHALSRGIAWASLPHWSRAVPTFGVPFPEDVDEPLRAGVPIGASRPTQAAAQQLREHGLNPDDWPAFLALRQELFELDTRFGQLGGDGIFEGLDRAGVLTHRVPGVDRVEQAVAEPPALGRAAIRGKVIRRGNGTGTYVCGWQHVLDLQSHRVLDLSNPFETTERWNDVPADDLGRIGEWPVAIHSWFRGRERRSRVTSRE